MVDNNIKHLEMIQQIINRMAQNSFALKGWVVTLISGIFLLATKDANSLFFLIAYVPIFLFWIIDSYYLQLERKFRKKYDLIRKLTIETDFDMKLDNSHWFDKTTLCQTLMSFTEVGFYIPTAIIVAILAILSKNLQ